MSQYAKVFGSLWGDRRFRGLSGPAPNAQTLYLFLLTTPSRVIPGVIPLGLGAIADLLGAATGNEEWFPGPLRERFAELDANGLARVEFRAPLIYLPSEPANDPPANPNTAKHWGRSLVPIPDCELKLEIAQDLKRLCERLGKRFAEGFEAGFGTVRETVSGTPIPLPLPLPLPLPKKGGRAAAGEARPRRLPKVGVVRYWIDAYLAANPEVDEETIPAPTRQDVLAAQNALAKYDEPTQAAIVRRFVETADDWTRERGCRLGLIPRALAGLVPAVIAEQKRTKREEEKARAKKSAEPPASRADAEKTWKVVRGKLRAAIGDRITDENFVSWFGNLHGHALQESALVLRTPNRLVAAKTLELYGADLLGAAERAGLKLSEILVEELDG